MTKDKFFANAVKYWQAKDYGLRLASGAFLPSTDGAESIGMHEIYAAVFKGSSPASLDNLRLSTTIPGSAKHQDAIIATMERMGKLANICGMSVAMSSDVKVHVWVCTIMDGDALSDDEIVRRFAGIHAVVMDCRQFALYVSFFKPAVVEHRGVISFSTTARANIFKKSFASKCTHAPILNHVSTQVWVVDLEAEEIKPYFPWISFFGRKMNVEKQWFFQK
ncbi:MAG: hypothetical protein WCK55_21935 [Verrucomicrobiota bacterium]